MKLGSFYKTDEGHFSGQVETLSTKKEIAFIPTSDAGNEKAPDYKIVIASTGTEIGAGWNRKAKTTGNPYIKAKIDDPFLPSTLWAALTQDDQGEYNLFWSRPTGKSGKQVADQETL